MFAKDPEHRPAAETSTDPDAVRDWPEAQSQFQGLLYSALSRLAVHGYRTTLEEARDLILDFFLDEWSGLIHRFDPSRARLSTYVYRAFVLYARPRIRHLMKWKNSLNDLSALSRQLPSQDTQPGPDSLEIASIRLAVAQLSDEERQALELAVAERASLAEVAAQAGVTRYRARELLCDAFGRVLVAFGERGSLSEQEWNAALAIWRDGEAPRVAARQMGISTEQIQEFRNKVLDFIGQGVRSANRLSTHTLTRKGTIMARKATARTSVTLTAAQLLSAAIQAESTQFWHEIRQRREEILEYLEDNDFELSEEEQQMLDEDPEILTHLLTALGDKLDDHLSAREQAAADDLIGFLENDERLVGNAFTYTLLPGLSDELREFDRWFLDVAPLSDNDPELQYLRERPDVMAANEGNEYPEDLLRYRVTPLTLLYASQAPQNVFNDLLKSGHVLDPRSICLGAGEHSTLPVSDVVREIQMLVECDAHLANSLYDYCFAIALDDHFYFWEGFRSKKDRNSILHLTPTDDKGVAERWKAYAPALAH
jgi:RNA polymerase sigma factor (sigma-70 family)